MIHKLIHKIRFYLVVAVGAVDMWTEVVTRALFTLGVGGT
jgi:hypothetical protein